ncbi:hypothetical protein E3U43_000118 [Larimichthys crocea]|uniref:Uncharacterized protein n=1 Tax=Larimichthys crocea TaxID=215358 RepID=A0ACD3Q9G0_LARCR|nr:hypothetical protein E3U43_000118 [Larimichthys crocea]
MSGCSTIHLTLPQWDGGSRKIRFIYLVNLTSFRLTDCPNESPMVPLYLGADLFSNTDIRTENHPRHHAKFAKKGLATKINFSSAFRFHGLKVPTVNNSLWFYSVQGLFRVAFEMYSKQEQLAVLENFQDVWKSQINDSPLKMSYNLSVQLDFAPSSSSCGADSRNEMPQPQRESVDVNSGDTSADHDYCSFPKQRLQTEQNQIITTVRQKLHSLDDKLSSETQSYTELEMILMLLENIDRYINGNLEEKDVTETCASPTKGQRLGLCVFKFPAQLYRTLAWPAVSCSQQQHQPES